MQLNPRFVPVGDAKDIATLFQPVLSKAFPPGTTFTTHERTNIFVSLPMDPAGGVYRSKVGHFLVDYGVVEAVLASASMGDLSTADTVAQYCARRVTARHAETGTVYSTFRLRIDKQALGPR